MLRLFGCLIIAAFAVRAETVYLVLLKGASAVAYYTPAGKLLATVPTGAHPHEMALSPDRRYLYTVDNGTMRIEEAGKGGNSLSVIDVAARRKIGDIPLGEFHRPHGIDVDSKTGRLAVSTELPDQFLIVDPVRRTVVKRCDTKGKTSHMVRFGPDAKYAYVSNSRSGDVSIIDIATCSANVVKTGERPEGSILAPHGRELYVANREGAGISVIDTARNQPVAWIPTGKGPVRVGITPDGKQLVYALMHEKKVGFADPHTRKQTGYVLLPYEPVSLNISRDGRLAFASAENADTVYVISIPDQKIVQTIQTQPGSHPDPVLDYTLP